MVWYLGCGEVGHSLGPAASAEKNNLKPDHPRKVMSEKKFCTLVVYGF
jgi:hypothetical protein